MAVTVTLADDTIVTHSKATKWIADTYGNLVIIEAGAKATNIYAVNNWAKATVTA